jgi:hypothetical protein
VGRHEEGATARWSTTVAEAPTKVELLDQLYALCRDDELSTRSASVRPAGSGPGWTSTAKIRPEEEPGRDPNRSSHHDRRGERGGADRIDQRRVIWAACVPGYGTVAAQKG